MSQNVIKRAVKNTTGLDSELLEDIFTFFGVLAEFDEQLAARVVAYIVDGKEDDMLLLALAGNNGAAITLGYNVTTGTQNYQQMQALSNRRHRMLRGQRVAPASMWIRMAEVLDAIARAANCSSTFPPEWPSWLGSFMMETASAVRAFYANPHPWSLYALEKILIEAKLPPDFLVSLILGGPYDNYFVSSNWYAYSGNPNGGCYADLGAYCNRHLPAVQSFLQRANADIRISALGVLATGGFDFSPIPDLLVQIACGSSKVARETALPLLMTCPEVARPLLENTLAKGAAAERHEAVLVLWRLFGTDAIGTLVQHAEKETAERVKQTIEKLIAAPDEGAADCAELQRQLPPLNLKLGVLPLPAEAKTKIAQYFQRGNEAALRHYEQEKKQFESVDKPKWMTKPVQTQPVGKDQVDELVAFVEGTTDTVPVSDLSNIARFAGLLAGDWLTAPDIELLHIVRLSLALRNLQIAGQARTYFWWRERTILEAYRESCQNSFGLRELEAAVASLPLSPPGQVAEAYLANNNSWQSFCDWEPEAVWPLYAEQPEKLQEILMPVRTIGSNDYNLPTKRANAFKVLSLFPQVPCEFITLLWDIALGEGKLERIMAQKALEALPGKASKIIVALKDGKQNIRSAAAEWLGKIGDQAAIEPLKEAFQKEKNEIAKGTIMLALDALKANVDQFLNRDDLASEAKSGLSKKLPKGMEWVPLDNLPKLHWEDTGKQVDTTIVRWWVMQAIQQKTPACGPILRRYLSMCRKKDANGLSRFILSSWIGRDTTTSPPEEAAQRARKNHRPDVEHVWHAAVLHGSLQGRQGKSLQSLLPELFKRTDLFGHRAKGYAFDCSGCGRR